MIAAPFEVHPEELLYSAWARYAARMPFLSQKAIRDHLFGGGYAAAAPAFPVRVADFVARLAPGHDYSVDQLIGDHTVVPYFVRFRSEEQIARVKQLVSDGGVGTPTRILGLQQSRIPFEEGLRFCDACYEADTNVFGSPFWRRVHQLPGVLVCPSHGIPLVRTTAGTSENSRARTAFTPLSPMHCATGVRDAIPSKEASVLKEIGEESQWLLSHPGPSLPAHVIAQRIRTLLRKNGCMRGNRVDFDVVRERIRSHWGEPVLARLGCVPGNAAGDWLALATYASRVRRMHPLEYVLLLRGLESSLSEILEPHDEVAPADAESHRAMFRNGRPNAAWEARLRSLVADERYNQRRIADRLGVSPDTVKSHAHRLGIWREGWKLDATSRSREERLRREPERLIAAAAERERRRSEWMELLEKNPGATRWELQQLDVRNYDWLREKDQEWLESHLPARKRVPGRASIDWGMRDRELLARAQQAVAELLAEPEPTWVTQHAVLVKISAPALFSAWKQKLPLTAAYVRDSVETGAEYVERKVRWAAVALQTEGERVTAVDLLRRAGMDRTRGTYKWNIAEALAAEHRVQAESALHGPAGISVSNSPP